MRIQALTLLTVLLAACAKSPTTPPASTPEPTGEAAPDDAGADRPELTAASCEEQGGKVVGDIGDGAIHRPEYRCADSGEAPIGSIVADPGGPMGVEGAVCCK